MKNIPSPLLELKDFENQVKECHVSHGSSVKVRIQHSAKFVFIEIDGVCFTGRIERPLIHQLGSRIYRNGMEYKEIEREWNKHTLHCVLELEQLISDILKNQELVIKYFQKSGINLIYGIVSTYFQKIDIAELREKFIQKASLDGLINGQSVFSTNRYGEIIEPFACNFDDKEIKMKYLLFHPRNNGYNAFKVKYGRIVTICTNGLTLVEGSAYRLLHSQSNTINEFFDKVLIQGYAQHQETILNIHAARSRSLDLHNVDLFLGGMTAARASKERVKSRLLIEMNAVGQNEWALSQSLTWLGNHENALPNGVKANFIGLGSSILDKSFNSILNHAN